ncbi:hypothetical protein Catovirus_2_293 [Catovirus CTV1]|uniref:Uncharacterized protein n=1 Tax=Catovirus CTV1 TaxID=1977631 RepID=A0A1V0SCI6_9VIRU|nr:hypothetical protein Catovirus_2_293 [Catovirus CTV1]
MNEQILKKYFDLCKKIDANDFSNIIKNINYNNAPQFDCIKHLLQHFGNNDQGKQKLIELYNKYHTMKGGSTTKTITEYFKKNFTVDKIKSTLSSSAKLIGSLLKSAAKSLYKMAKENPDETMSLIKTIHNNTTAVLLSEVITDQDTKNEITAAFDEAFVLIDGALRSGSKITEQKGGFDADYSDDNNSVYSKYTDSDNQNYTENYESIEEEAF